MIVGTELQPTSDSISHMNLVRLGDHVEILSGFAFDSSRFATDGEMPLIRIRDVVRSRTETYYTGSFDERFVVRKGDLLIGMDGDFNRETWSSEPALLNQRVCRIAPLDACLDPRYLYHFLPQALMEIWHATPFATVKHLSVKAIREIVIPLPSIKEQRRIAAILDKADELRTKRRLALTHLDALTESIFNSMFVDPLQIRPSYSVKELAANIPSAIRTGPFGSQLLTSEFTDEGVAVLGIDNAVDNKFTWKKRRFISQEKYSELKRYTVRPGDFIVTIMGTLGRCAVIPEDIPVAINTKHLCCITLDRTVCLPEFLQYYFLNHPTARRYLGQTTKGSIMGGLNMGIIKNLPVELPSLAEQEIFTTHVAGVERLKELHRTQLAELDDMFGSLQHRAFNGEPNR